MLLQNLQTAALLIIVCECGWHKIALCQNALPLQIKVVYIYIFFFLGGFWPSGIWVICFCGQGCFRSIMLIGAIQETLVSLLLKGFPRSGRRSCLFGEMVSCSFDLYV